MIYIGVDQSYRCTGVTIIDETKKLLGTITIRGNGQNIGTLAGNADRLSAILDAHRYCHPGQVTMAIEQPAISAGGRSSSSHAQAELAGAMQYAALSRGIRVEVVPLSSWKSKIARNRLRGISKTTKAGQAEYLRICTEVLGYEHETPDQADAHMIALYQLGRDSGEIPAPKKKAKKRKK